MADSKKYDGSQWEHSLRKLTTATEAVENPLYSDGTAITSYTIKGNTVQNGTPTPQNPVDVNGVGVRTENLFDGSYTDGYIGGDTGTRYSTSSAAKTAIVKCEPNTTYTIKKITSSNRFTIATSASYPQDSDIVNVLFNSSTEAIATITTPADASYLLIYVSTSSEQATPNMMLNVGSTAKPYEPYGYKIPISSGGVTTNIYLGSTQTVRQIKKLVLTGQEDWTLASINSHGIANFRYPDTIDDRLAVTGNVLSSHFTVSAASNADATDESIRIINTGILYLRRFETDISTVTGLQTWLAQQYSNGTPVTVWYVLATPETAAVNEPLMRIGDYADTLSNAASIPTTEGANGITVDTAVQPSEFTATWTGWHNASVQEYVGGHTVNLFDDTNVINVADLGERYGVILPSGTYSIYNNTDNNVYYGTNNWSGRQKACDPHSTATIELDVGGGGAVGGFFMPLNSDSQGGCTIVEGSTPPDHYIPYYTWVDD